ncbi:heterokaryon incompatibility protein-domain-containing protein [Leptodontidium sp. MPI-SDFR-AT-0119]|nr:heterokaryon incompatibility protein-domain-containing protein [Leptodontidium sp. MPI-SDFR-AT-0119]
MSKLCAKCISFGLTAESFASQTVSTHKHSGTGCADSEPSHHAHGTDCNGQCDYSTITELSTGLFSDIKKETSCALCQLVCQAVEEQYASESREPEVQCKIRIKRHRGHNLNGEKNYKMLQIVLATANAKREAGMPIVDLLPVVSDLERYHGFFTGKKIKESCIDGTEVKSWIDECQRSHAGPCRHTQSAQFEELSPHLRVIDVENNCLAMLPKGAEFCALSYVWGQERSPFQATHKNLPEISRFNGLTNHSKELPRVIQDAMMFTRMIHQRYLWIDRLCVLQDSTEEKAKIIPRMNIVYENAFLTLFSCGWGDASCELGGVRPGSIHRKQNIARIAPDLELIMPHNLEAVLRSPWAARGWTYQEFFSARRKLIFINGQVTLICRNESYREDLVRSHTTIFQTFMRLGPQEWQPPLQDQLSIELHQSFMQYIEEYTKRKLSFDSDILNAFAGVINLFRSDVQLGSTFGIPNNTFGLDILWNPEEYLERRGGLPSWSWAGWKGRIRRSQSGIPKGPAWLKEARVRTYYAPEHAWLAGMFFLAFYIYDSESSVFRLVHDVASELAHNREQDWEQKRQRAGCIETQQPDFPEVDLHRDISFDPRNRDLEPLKSVVQRFTRSAPNEINPVIPQSLHSLPINHALYFRTIVARVYISTLGPVELENDQPRPEGRGDSMEDKTCPSSRYVYLFDASDKLLGLAWLCTKASHNRLAQLCAEKVAAGEKGRVSMDVAVVSGPVVGNWRTRKKFIGKRGPDIDMDVITRSAAAYEAQFSSGKICTPHVSATMTKKWNVRTTMA